MPLDLYAEVPIPSMMAEPRGKLDSALSAFGTIRPAHGRLPGLGRNPLPTTLPAA
jgi:hypothetical protein